MRMPLNQAVTYESQRAGQQLLLSFHADEGQIVSLQSDALFDFDVEARFADGSRQADIYAGELLYIPASGFHVLAFNALSPTPRELTIELVGSAAEPHVPGNTLQGELAAAGGSAIYPLSMGTGDLVSFGAPQSDSVDLELIVKDREGYIYAPYSSYGRNLVVEAEAGYQYWLRVYGSGPFTATSALVQPESVAVALDDDVRGTLPSGGEWKVHVPLRPLDRRFPGGSHASRQ